MCFPTFSTADAATQTIVILHSHHQGYEWTDSINDGICSVFESQADFELAYEYLDASRTSPASFERFEALFAAKYTGRQPSVVIAVDDNALLFLIEHRRSIFTDVPVVFCGINDISVYNEDSLSGMTGVTESPDIIGSIELALQVLPETKRILVLGDETTSGSMNLRRLDHTIQNLPAGLEIARSIAPEPEELLDTLSRLEQGTVILYLSYARSAKGRRLTVKESVGLVAGNSPVPVFGCWDFIVEAGAFGGKVVSGNLQGIAAAERALRVSKGESPASIPIGAPESYESVLDYHQLKRFKLKPSTLPAGIKILDKPTGTPIWVIQGLVTLIFVIVLEGLTIVLVLRSRKMLVLAEKRYRTLAEQLPAIVYSVEFGEQTKTTYVSPQLSDMLGYDPQSWMNNPKAWLEAVHPDDRAKILVDAKAANIEGKPVIFEYRAVSAKGDIKFIKNHRAYYSDAGGKLAAIGVWTDVTEEQKAQKHIKSALAEKELLLKEIHHRVKNNFQIVSSLLRLETEQLSEGPAFEALSDTERRIFAMSLVHEQLYQCGDFGHIDFNSYAQRIGDEMRSLADSRNPVGFSVEGDELSFGIDMAVPLGLFLNEALMNAFKHAFPANFKSERGVRVLCARKNGEETISIQDTGAGFEPSSNTNKSLGLTLMNILAIQIGGSMTIDSKPGSGTRVCLTLAATAGKELGGRGE
jgi:PAS domain S-box-containing protein